MIVFQNPGLIPLEGIFTMGLHAKVGKSPIGFFGTGLKLSIGTILRLGGSITIYRGMDPMAFVLEHREVRGKSFQFVMAQGPDGQKTPLNITTELGKNWRPWMAMRELESNCRDECGSSWRVEGEYRVEARDGWTTILVNCEEVEHAWQEMDKYFLSSKPLWDHKGIVELHPKRAGDNDAFFYRSIKVGDLHAEFPYRVNVVADFSSELTEDRSLNNHIPAAILCRAIPMLGDRDILSNIFPNQWRENDARLAMSLDYHYYADEISDGFLEFIMDLRNKNFLAVPQSINELLIKLRKLDKHDTMRTIAPTKVQLKMLERARQFAADLGYDRSTFGMYPVFIADLGETTMGMADPVNEKIYISPKTFGMGQKYVCSTYLEEYLHCHHGLRDMTRELQNHLFDRLATVMEEHFYKEPI